MSRERPSRGAKPAAASRRPSRLGATGVATFGLLASVALIFGYVEALFPLPIPIPGIKLGLGNIVVLLALLSFGPGPAAVLMVVKVVASAMMFGNPAVLAYSLAGGVVSLAAMAAATRLPRISVVGVSMAGGVFHMVGQAVVVAVVLAPYVALTYLPILIVSGLATGLLTGYVCRLVIRSVGKTSLFKNRRKAFARRTAAAMAPGGADSTEERQ